MLRPESPPFRGRTTRGARASTSMGWRCLSSSRLLLWRRAIYLFDETARGHWQGPFATAGYRWPLPDHPPYIVSRRVLDFEGHDLTPDIVSASSQHWAVLELTLHPSSKAADMAKYARINPGSFSNYGLNCPKVEPDLIVGRIGPFDDGPYAQVLLGPTLHTERIADIKDPLLREALRAAEGTDLAHIPEIPVAFLPESRGPELRQGLVDLVMALFRPERPAVSPAEFVERCLE